MGYTSAIGLLFLTLVGVALAGDMLRKSIVYDKNTPDVFYCPQTKPTGFDNMIVKAKSLKKLCEFEGRQLPEDYKSDCYNDVDETDFACKEKQRIMKRLNLSTIAEDKITKEEASRKKASASVQKKP